MQAPRSAFKVPLAGIDPQIIGLFLCLVALVVLFATASPYFMSVQNLSNMLLSVTVIGTMAAISTLVRVSRGLDLSVGSIVGLVGVVAALTIQASGSPFLGIVVGLLAGAVWARSTQHSM